MSSILRALKKVEEETRSAGSRTDNPVAAGQTGTSPKESPGPPWRVFIVPLILLIGALAWWLSPPAPESPRPPVLSPKSPPSPVPSPAKAPAPSKIFSPPPEPSPRRSDEARQSPVRPVLKSESKPVVVPIKSVQKEPATKNKFNLRGILWSENPDRRVALIGDRYLKEGEKIDGMEVVRIERKTVTFRSMKNGTTHTLRVLN